MSVDFRGFEQAIEAMKKANFLFKSKLNELQISAIVSFLMNMDDLDAQDIVNCMKDVPLRYKTFPSLEEIYRDIRRTRPVMSKIEQKRAEVYKYWEENAGRYKCSHCKDTGLVTKMEKCKPVFPGGPEDYETAYKCPSCDLGDTTYASLQKLPVDRRAYPEHLIQN